MRLHAQPLEIGHPSENDRSPPSSPRRDTVYSIHSQVHAVRAWFFGTSYSCAEMLFPSYHPALYRTSSVAAGFKHIKLGGFGGEEFDWRKAAGRSSEAVGCNKGVSPDSRSSPAGHVSGYTSARTAIAAINLALRRNASRSPTTSLHHGIKIEFAASAGGHLQRANDVYRSALKWRTRHDSNVWPSPSEGDALSS